jgi:glycosyltransferase involved in cell wall biosynthesis
MGPCFPKDGLLTVVSVGRLSPEKAFDRAIKVHSRLDKKGISFRWYIVGEGDERPKLEKEIEECKLQRKFILLGAKMNPYPYIAQADIFVLPSLFEGCSIVVNEAKILKRPILVTDVGAAREQIVSERTGLIVDNKEKAIFEGLKRLLQNEALRKKFSRALSGFEYENESIYKQIEQVFFPEDKR